MAGGPACNKSEASACQVFAIDRAELHSLGCEIGPTAVRIDIKIKGRGHGALYNSKMKVYHVPGIKQSKYCELKWDDIGTWENNSIERTENLLSDSDQEFVAWIKKTGNSHGRLDFDIKVTFEHEVEGHQHKVKLDVALV